jgi:hypothetical protein
MRARNIPVVFLMLAGCFPSVLADAREDLQRHLNEVVGRVRAAEDPATKRRILENEFNALSDAIGTIHESQLISEQDRKGLSTYRALINEKREELMGENGFDRVPDASLDAYSVYVLQDLEQGAQTVTISLVALLLIIIIVILLV